MLADTPSGRAPFPAMLHLYVPDVDASYDLALKGGAPSISPPTDAPDGDRGGSRLRRTSDLTGTVGGAHRQSRTPKEIGARISSALGRRVMRFHLRREKQSSAGQRSD